MLNPIHEKEIILELTFAIKATSKETLFKETLPFYVKKLNCLSAFILEKDKINVASGAVFPKAFLQDLDLEQVKHIIKEECLKELYFCCSRINKLHYTIFKLTNFGYFVLVRNQPISPNFCKSLIPVFQFYANALENAEIAEEKNRIQTQIDQEIAIQNLLIKMASTYVNIDLKDIESNIQNSLTEIGAFVNADRSYIFNYDKELKTSSNTYEWCSEGISPEIDNLQNIPTSEIPDWINKHKLGQAFVVEDVSKLPDGGEYCLKNILSSQGIKSLITLPLVYKSNLMGFVGFDSVKQIRTYTNKEKSLLQLFAELLVNIQLRKEAQEKLKYQEQKYQSLLENVEIGLIEVDNHFNVEFINETSTKLFGYTIDEVEGKNAIEQFIPVDNQDYLMRALNKLEPNQNLNLELDAFTKDRFKRSILISLGTKNNIYGEKTGIIGAFIDNTKQKKLEKQLIKAKKVAEVAANEKEKFLANISHEMRTPLNVINGNINELINYKNKTEDRKTLLNQTINASSYLLNLVNNVLDLAKIKAGKVSLDSSNFNLKDLCQNTFTILAFLAKKNNNQYFFNFDEQLNIDVHSDATKISQVLVNFLNNALKFTNNGSVKFSVKCLQKNENYVDVLFSIKDDGIGIEKKFLNDIFSEFSREKNSNENSGTGLGMPISKNIIDLLNGKINIESQKNKGTLIELFLNLKTAEKQSRKKKEHKKFDLLREKNILLVEDNQMNALIAKRILEREKANISLAKNGLEAIEALKEKNNTYDLILMDIQMPKMDGIKATKVIRNKLSLATPIIAITANVFKTDLDSYINKGINKIITKPFTEKKLLETCTSIFVNKLKDTEQNEDPKINIDYNLKNLNEIAAGDSNFIDELLSTFQILIKETVTKLDQAYLSKNVSLIKNALHKIKPSISDLMLDELLEKIKLVENSDDVEVIEYQTNLIKIALIKLEKNISNKHLSGNN